MTYDEAIAHIKANVISGDPSVVPVNKILPQIKRFTLYRLVAQGTIPAVKAAGRVVTIASLAEKFFEQSMVPACQTKPKAKPVRAKGSRLQQIEQAEARVLGK